MKGFTLVETMVAVTVLTIAVAGPMTAASRSLVAASIAKEQLTASYLAQEGIEYARSVRDDVYLTDYQNGTITDLPTTAWNDFLSYVTSCKSTDGSRTCLLDPLQPMGVGSGRSLQPCSGSGCNVPLNLYNNAYTLQTGSGAVVTPYTRTVKVLEISSTMDEEIVSTVTWLSHGTTHSVSVTDHLTPWE